MSSLQPFITVIQTAVEDILKAEGMTLVQKKAFAATIVSNLVKANTHLTDEEKALVNLVIPFLFSEAEVVERVEGCVKSGCFSGFVKLFKKCKKNTSASAPEEELAPVPIPVVLVPAAAPKVDVPVPTAAPTLAPISEVASEDNSDGNLEENSDGNLEENVDDNLEENVDDNLEDSTEENSTNTVFV